MMKKRTQRRVAEVAARLMAEGTESEYLHAKETALSMLGLSNQSRMPSNRIVKEMISRITRSELGDDEVDRRLQLMRQIAQELLILLDDCDPFLIGSTLTGEIRETSDIDLHAYCDDFEELKSRLAAYGYDDVEEDLVENLKGRFVHLRWHEDQFPVEITIYPWSMRAVVPISSVTGQPMRRADLRAVQRLLARDSA